MTRAVRWTPFMAVLATAMLGCSEPTANVGGLTSPATETGDPGASSSSGGAPGSTESSTGEATTATTAVADDSSTGSTESGGMPLLDVGAGETGIMPIECEDAPDVIHVLVW